MKASPPPPPDEPVIVAAPGPLVIKQRAAHASNYPRVRQNPRRIVLHCTDGHEGFRKDDDVAAMFAAPLPPGKRRSAHYIGDGDSITMSVPEAFQAWHCGPSGNLDSIGIEMCGRAMQTRAEWLDAVSLPMLCLVARLIAEICVRRAIPCHVVMPRGLIAGEAGITTHQYVRDAWQETRHYDPGPHFPLAALIRAAAAAVAEMTATPPAPR